MAFNHGVEGSSPSALTNFSIKISKLRFHNGQATEVSFLCTRGAHRG
jgi:hypothetical protein